MERPEIARLVNCANKQKLGFGETPSVRALQAIQWMKVWQVHDERIDMVMGSKEEGEEPSAVGRCVLRKNGTKYFKTYSAVSDGS